jgi:hypothetical protein
LILENLGINKSELSNLKLNCFNCDVTTFDEIMLSLKQIMQSLTKKYNFKESNLNYIPEFYEDDVLANRVSMDIVLEDIAKIRRKDPEPEIVVETKIS